MGGIKVNAYDVKNAAKKFSAAAKQVSSADPSGHLAPIGTALPGSDSAAAVGALATDWKAEFTGWTTKAQDQHDKLVKAADNYEKYEKSVQDGMRKQSR